MPDRLFEIAILHLAVLLAICLFLCGFSSGCSQHECKIVAHRGASGLAPENTAASVELAFEMGADASEIDVYLTSDHRIMVIHDKTTKRTAGIDLPVSQTESARLRELEVGSFKSSRYDGEKIPYIEEIFERVPENKKLLIEVKSGPEIVPYLAKAIDESGKKERMVIIAFDFDVLLESRKVMPSVPLYWLVGATQDEDTGEYLPFDPSLIETAAAHHITGLDLDYHGLTAEFVDQVHAAGLEMHVWTVNSRKDAERMVMLGVDSITTNYPDIFEKRE